MNGPQLRDIHLPADPLWWPPAPGWWLLPLLAILLLAGLLWWRRRLRQPPLASLSRRELARIRRQYGEGRIDPRTAVDTAARLLRRILIGYRGRAVAASSTGDGWLRQLEELVPRHGFSAEQLRWLCRDRYRPDADYDVDALLDACDGWIRALPRNAGHVAD